MTLEQALLKIIELMKENAELKEQIQVMKPQPYVQNPFIYTVPDLCTDGGLHDYPNPWMSVTPPHCTKCGKQASNAVISITSHSLSKVD